MPDRDELHPMTPRDPSEASRAGEARDWQAASDEWWRPIPGYASRYQVSNQGRVRSLLFRGRVRVKAYVLKPSVNYGYHRVSLYDDNGQPRIWAIHRLVLLAFRGQPAPGQEASHLNGVRDDNRLDNLEWATHRENQATMVEHGNQARGERVTRARLTAGDVRHIRALNESGGEYADIARDLGLHVSHVSKVCRREIWRHV